MIKLISYIILLFFPVYYTDGIHPEKMLEGVKKGDAVMIARYFDKAIDITVNNKSHTYSKSQGTMVLRDFFSNHSVVHFEITQVSKETDKHEYLFGNLVTSNGTFRTFILLKSKGDVKMLHEIRIE